ncbi:MAG: peptide-binding protein [Candidatus Wallbacteria bacterium]|nr:peptide-binding protein [Candidatus Wallbacteria bacterium]
MNLKINLKHLPLLFLFLLAGCGGPPPVSQIQAPPPDESPAVGDTLVEGALTEALTLNPVRATESASSRVSSMIYQGLVKQDKNLQSIGDLAETWEIADNGKTITFHLKKGIFWHDGLEFTSEDAYFTYSNKWFYWAQFIETMETLDDYTIRFHYKNPFASAVQKFAIPVIPKHVFKTHENIYNDEFIRTAVGTGPYRFKEWRSGDELVLEANPQYFEGMPYIKEYVFKTIPDPSMAFLSLLRGDIDLLKITPDQYVKQCQSDDFQKHFNVYRYPNPFSVCHFGYNEKKPFFSDKLVRKAMTMALDRQAIIRDAFHGFAQLTDGPWPKSSWAYNKEITPLPYSPEKAATLLAEAGWKDTDEDGILEKDGVRFECDIMFLNGIKAYELTAWMAADYWKKVGIKASLKPCEISVIMDACYKLSFDINLSDWSLQDPDLYYYFHRWEIPEPPEGKGGRNAVSYLNLEVCDLIQKGRTTMEIMVRTSIYHRLHELIYEDQPYTFLCNPECLYAVAKRIHGIEVAPSGITHNYYRWYVPLAQQKYHN